MLPAVLASVVLAWLAPACDTASADYPQAREPALLLLSSWNQPTYSLDQNVVVPEDIVVATATSLWTFPITGTMLVDEYVGEVEYQRKRLDPVKTALATLEADSRGARELPEGASEQQIREAKKQLFEAIWRNQEVWMTCYFGLARRAELGSPAWKTEGLPNWEKMATDAVDPQYRIDEVGPGDLIVSHDMKQLPIPWTMWYYGDPAQEFEMQRAASALAWSFVSAEPTAFTYVQRATQKCVAEVDTLSDLQNTLAESLVQFERAHYEVLLVNASSLPVVVQRSEVMHGGERIELEFVRERAISTSFTGMEREPNYVVVDAGDAKVIVFAANTAYDDDPRDTDKDELRIEYLYYEDGSMVSVSRTVQAAAAGDATAY
jgi:hypothetical protein